MSHNHKATHYLVLSAPHVIFTILAGALGIFLGAPNPVLHMPFLSLVLPIAIFSICNGTKKRKQALRSSWFIGFLGYSLALYWLYYPLHFVGQLPVLLTIPCILLMGSFLGLYTCMAGLCFWNLQKFFLRTPKYKFINGLAFAIFGGLSFGGIEVLTGWLFTGFPWFPISTAFSFWPAMVQLASVLGTFGLSAIYVCAALLLALALHTPVKKLNFLVFILIIISSFLFGQARLKSSEGDKEYFSFLAVQGNVDQNKKWDSGNLKNNLQHYISISQKALDEAKQNVDLVIWPETALPYVFDYKEELSQLVHNFVAEHNVVLAFGTLGYKKTPQARYLFNRLQILAPQMASSIFYDKQHLVPFGEYIPFSLQLPFLQNILQGVDFAPGKTSKPLVIEHTSLRKGKPENTQSMHIGTLICYEAIFPHIAQKMVENNANMFLTISNDGWFGKTSAPFQHLGLSVMRSIEQYRPMLRVTNSGITANIDKYGRILHKGGLFTDETTILTLIPENQKTIFHHIKTFISIVLGAGLFFGLFAPMLMPKK